MIERFKSWVGLVDIGLVLITGHSMIKLFQSLTNFSLREITTYENIGNSAVIALGLFFGILRLIDYFIKREILKSTDIIIKETAKMDHDTKLAKKRTAIMEEEITQIKLKHLKNKEALGGSSENEI
jgi:hypothetical protein